MEDPSDAQSASNTLRNLAAGDGHEMLKTVQRWREANEQNAARLSDEVFATLQERVPALIRDVPAVERGTDALLKEIALIGDDAQQWSQAMIQTRGIEGVRVLAGLKSLAKKHDSVALNNACRKALSYGAFRLKTIRELLKRDDGKAQQQFGFLEEHPVIRPLNDYSLESLAQFRKDRTDERVTG